ncbi:MAG TPA: hypothetical protein VL326_24860 [Kofleriaceae bacterium]|jgi:hypothetical protein|nr:hypothetical protein [Kofleriaceae bacterium]
MKRLLVLLVACKAHESGGVGPLPPDMPDDNARPHHATKIDVPEQLGGVPLFVSDLDGYALFEDEQLQAANIVAAWARGQGLSVQDPKATREIFYRAARGQHAVTGQACGAPLWRTLAISRWREQMKSKGRIEAGVYCTPTCWLDVRISLGLDIGLDDGPTAFYAAPFDPSQPWATELPKRLDELITWRAPGEPTDPIAAVPGAVPLPAVTVPGFNRGEDDQPAPSVPPGVLAAAQACVGAAAGAGVVIQTSATGVVEKCESFDRRIISNVPVADCICKALMGQTVGKTAMRTPVGVFGDEVKTMTKSGMVVNASADAERALDPMTRLYKPVVSDPSIEEWESPQPWVLAPCFQSATGNVEANVKLEFDRSGKATSVTVKATTGTLSKDAETCLKGVYAKVVAPCPDVDKATATGVVHAFLAKP